MLRHGTDPEFLLGIIPRIPVHLVAAEAGPGRHGKAAPVQFHHWILGQSLEGSLHIFRCNGVLGFKILMKYPDGFTWVVFFLEIQS